LQIKNRCQKLLFFKKFNEAVVKISARSEKLLAFVVKGLSKTNSQDTAPGILIFSDLLNSKTVSTLFLQKARSFMTFALRDRVKIVFGDGF
jgi:hypothetical protein